MKNYPINFNDIFSKLKNIKHSYDKKGLNPTRDWNIILVLGFFAVVCVVIYSSIFYYQINNSLIFQVDRSSDTSRVDINRPVLDQVTKEIDTKIIEFFNSESMFVDTIDPGV